MNSKIADVVLRGLRPLVRVWVGKVVQVDKQNFKLIDSVSHNVGLKVVIHNGQLIITLFGVHLPEKEISLYNLLCYLGVHNTEEYWPRFFEEESDCFVRCQKQIKFEVDKIILNLPPIRAFFREAGFQSRLKNLEQYIIRKYPQVFKRISEEQG